MPGPERMAQSAEIERRVQAALGELSPLERAAFTLRHYEGRSIDEISAALEPRDERRQAQRVSCGEEAAHRAGAAEESGIVSARHYSEDDLTLYYYGEGRRRDAIEQHLGGCAGVRVALSRHRRHARDDRRARSCPSAAISTASRSGSASATSCRSGRSRGGRRCSSAIGWCSPRPRRCWCWSRSSPAACGRGSRRRLPASARRTAGGAAAAACCGRRHPATRILLTSVAEHLDRSERVLTDIMNAPDTRRHLDRAALGGRPADHEPAVSAGRGRRRRAIGGGGARRRSSAACSKSSTAPRRSARPISSRFGGGSTRRRCCSKCG